MHDSEKALFGPPEDTPILPWYDGAYTVAFVALHPFFRVPGLDPAICEYGTLILDGCDRPDGADFLDWTNGAVAERRTGKELDGAAIDNVAKRFAEPFGWRSICEEVGFSDHRDLNRALRTSIGGLKPE
ncbi:MAG: hypothetical protein ACREB5_00505, partial [Sphingomonadaceae bacterium]